MEVLFNGIDTSGHFPELRKEDINKFIKYKNIPLNAIEYGEGTYLEGIDKFDSSYFRISPKEASTTDPHHRLFLQVAVNALEDSGYGVMY